MPEVGIFDSPQMNAFATGATEKSALVAINTGLLRSMSKDEIGHVANGDMRGR